MKLAQKKQVKLQAWPLGQDSGMERQMISEGKIIRRKDGRYELFSLEVAGEVGQIAEPGDYFKVDTTGHPYPNEHTMFEKKHRHIEGNWYVQITEPVRVWTKDEPLCDEISFLLATGRLTIHPDDPKHYYKAILWGTEETAEDTAVVVFYQVIRNEEEQITQIDFNFVVRDVFDQTYEIIE